MSSRAKHARSPRVDTAGGRDEAGRTLPVRSERAAVSAIEYAISLVAARSLPEKKLREKIASRYDADQTDGAIARMRELRLVDDAAWAERFARDRFERSSKGSHRIRRELVAMGIDKTSIDAALERVLDLDAEREKAAAVLERMRSRLDRGFDRDAAGDAETTAVATDGDEMRAAERMKTRLFRRLLARGYPAGLVRDLLDVS